MRRISINEKENASVDSYMLYENFSNTGICSVYLCAFVEGAGNCWQDHMAFRCSQDARCALTHHVHLLCVTSCLDYCTSLLTVQSYSPPAHRPHCSVLSIKPKTCLLFCFWRDSLLPAGLIPVISG